MRTLSKVLTVIVLVGCIIPGRVLAQFITGGGATYRNQLQDTDDNNRCVIYGAQPGTEAYADCRAQLSQAHVMALQAEADRHNTEEGRKAALVQQFLANQARQQQDLYDQQMSNIRASGQRTLQPASTKNCITNYVGNSAYTSCQ